MQRSGAASRRFRQGQLPVIDRDRKPRESVNCLLPVCIFFCAGLLIGLGQGQEAPPAVVEPPPRVVAAPNAASVAAEKAHVHHQHVAAGNFVSEVDDDDEVQASIRKSADVLRSLDVRLMAQPDPDETPALRGAAPAAPAAADAAADVDARVYAFYYAWYQSPAVDGRWAHWNHEHLPHWDAAVRRRYPPFTHDPDRRDVGAAFFPRLGAYSSADGAVIDAHFAQMAAARIGVVVVSWYPPGKRDPNGPEVDGLVGRLLDAALARGLALCLHLEPWEGRTAAAQLADVAYAVERYGGHAAYHRVDGRPAFFAYDSYQIAAADWRAARRAADDGAWLAGLVLDAAQLDAYVGDGGFDAAYSYFGAARFTQAATPDRWPALVAAAARRGGSFVPCVSPGYDDTRVRPWNGANARSRDGGAYYDDEWRAAVASGAGRVAVTSFNEWHEGTQVEAAVPAAPDRDGVPAYADYAPGGADFYLARTAAWVATFAAARGGA